MLQIVEEGEGGRVEYPMPMPEALSLAEIVISM
jgi:hypothetical protein